jgi:cytochrome c biogenesis protein ResB
MFGATPYEVVEVPTTNMNAIVALAEGNNATDIRGGTFIRGGQEARVAVMAFSGDSPAAAGSGGPDFVVRLGPGESKTEHGLTFTFNGLHYFSGVVARKDPGATFIWLAACLFIPGVWITFWFARRRIWVQVVGTEARLAGMADRFVDLQKEIDEIIVKLGGGPPPAPVAGAPDPRTSPAMARS